MLALYTHPFSTFARRVELALLEKGIEARRVVVDMPKREHKSDAFLALHPYGRVPVLVDDDFVLPESTPILEYLEAKFPKPPLLPESLHDRARVALHMKLCDLELASPSYAIIFAKRFLPKEKWRLEEMQRGQKQIARHFQILARELAGKDFLVADRFTLADLCYIPFLHFLDLLDSRGPRRHRSLVQRLARSPERQSDGAADVTAGLTAAATGGRSRRRT